MKKNICVKSFFVFIILALMGTTFADDTNDEMLETSDNYSLNEVIRVTKSNDLDIERYNTLILEATMDYADKLDESEALIWKHKDVEEYEELLMSYEFEPFLAKKDIEKLGIELNHYVSELNLEVTRLYLDILFLEDSIEKKELEVSYYNDLLEEINHRLDLGLVTNTDVILAEYDYISSDQELNILKTELSDAYYRLKIKMGIDLDEEVSIEPINLNLSYSFNILSLIDDITPNDYEIMLSKIELEIAQKKYDVALKSFVDRYTIEGELYENYYDEPSDFDNIKDELEDQKLTYQKLIRNQKINYLMKYNTLENSRISYEISLINYDAAVRNFKLLQVQNDLNMITDIELKSGKINLNAMVLSLDRYKYDLYLSTMEFNNMIKAYK